MGRPKNSVDRMLIVDVDTSKDCWKWTGAVSKNGYGKTTVGGASKLPHRLFYEHFKGPIPDGLQIDHLCRNRVCVNPAHLEAVTLAENLARGTSPSANNARKTECLRGHPLFGVNLYTGSDGRRQCNTCRAAAAKKHRVARGNHSGI